MADRSIKLRDLRSILRRYGVTEDSSRGSGSHTMFFRTLPEGTFSYPVPDKKDVLVCYLRNIRKRFRLTAADGVADEEFYGK